MTTKQHITANLTIGWAARETGLSVKAIRFYENGGYVRTVPRSDTGYRLYSTADLNRLRLIRRARQLGMALPEIRSLIDKVLSADCNQAMGHLSGLLSKQRSAIDAQIAELEALRTDLDRVEEHLRHCECAPGAMANECDYCLIPESSEDGRPFVTFRDESTDSMSAAKGTVGTFSGGKGCPPTSQVKEVI